MTTTTSTVGSAPARRPRLTAVGRWTIRALALVGALALVLTGLGAADDLQEFDQTRGGYDPPYEGWTGTPIDWSAGAVTSTGYLNPGRIVSTTMDCTSGMLTFVVLGVELDYRVVSGRALAVHKPREACADAGFDPQF